MGARRRFALGEGSSRIGRQGLARRDAEHEQDIAVGILDPELPAVPVTLLDAQLLPQLGRCLDRLLLRPLEVQHLDTVRVAEDLIMAHEVEEATQDGGLHGTVCR